MPEVVILSAVRTPYGRLLGSLADLPAASLGSKAVAAALDRALLRPEEAGRVFLGNTSAHALRGNPAAAAAREAGIPSTIPAVTLRAGCASGLLAIIGAVESILSGGCEFAVAGGFESVSSAPHLATGLRRGLRLGGGSLLDAARHDGPVAVPVGGEADLSTFLRSCRDGITSSSIVPIEAPSSRRGAPAMVDRDDAAAQPDGEAPREEAPSSAPPLADGAAALVLASASVAEKRGLRPLAVVRPVLREFEKEIVRSRIVEADLPEKEARDLARALPAGGAGVVNSAGGGANLGHAAGADGARLVVSLLPLLLRAGGGTGLAMAAGGWGEPAGVVVEI